MWVDAEQEIDRLRALLRDALPFVNDAGDDEDPEARRYAIETADAIRRALDAGLPTAEDVRGILKQEKT
jgi:hypothetical protein